MSCRIALFLHNEGEYQELVWDDCQRAAYRHGFPVRSFWAENDSQKQSKQIHACLAEREDLRPNVVMVSPVREVALSSTAYAAAGLGIGWVFLLGWNSYVADLHKEFSKLPIFAVTVDQHEIGRIQGQQFRALLPKGGKLVYIRGPLGTSYAMRRFGGVQEVLRDSAIELVPLNGDWSLRGGRRAMGEWLAAQKVGAFDFVLAAQNDAMAMGARQALEELARTSTSLSLERVRICGCDGTPSYGRRLVKEQRLTSTVVMPSGADRAVDEIAAMLAGGPRPPAQIPLPPASFPELAGLVP
jgi:ABC-type sugar transport system substrate-binding protein